MVQHVRVGPWAVAAAALALLAVAGAAAADEVAVDLKPGETFTTGWITVPQGMEASWATVNGSGFVNWAVDSRPYGELAGGDEMVAAGCARADETFDMRLRLENTVPGSVREAHFTLSVDIHNATPGCKAAGQLAMERADYVASHRPWITGEDLFRLGALGASGAMVAVVVVSLVRMRKARRRKGGGGPGTGPGEPPGDLPR